MDIKTVSSREFSQDVDKTKRATGDGPVFITDRGQATHVLLSIAEYQRITSKGKNIIELLAMPGIADIDCEPVRVREFTLKPVDFD